MSVYLGCSERPQASLTSACEVAGDFNCVRGASQVWVNPISAFRQITKNTVLISNSGNNVHGSTISSLGNFFSVIAWETWPPWCLHMSDLLYLQYNYLFYHMVQPLSIP